jgi:hypothetical protein
MAEVIAMTLPQLSMLEESLVKINEAEYPSKDKHSDQPNQSDAQANTLAIGATLKLLQDRTGRKTFSLQELNDPAGTIRKYGEQGKDLPPKKD